MPGSILRPGIEQQLGPGPKILGEIKTSWRAWLLSFSGSRSGFHGPEMLRSRMPAGRGLEAACLLARTRVIAVSRWRARNALLTLAGFSKHDLGGKEVEVKLTAGRPAPALLSSLRNSAASLGPAVPAVRHFPISRTRLCVAVGLPG